MRLRNAFKNSDLDASNLVSTKTLLLKRFDRRQGVRKFALKSTLLRQKKLSLSTGCPSGKGGLKRDFLEVAFSSHRNFCTQRLLTRQSLPEGHPVDRDSFLRPTLRPVWRSCCSVRQVACRMCTQWLSPGACNVTSCVPNVDYSHVFSPCVSKQCPADGVWRIGRRGSPDRVLKTRFNPSESSTGHGLPPQRAPKQCPANGVRRVL